MCTAHRKATHLRRAPIPASATGATFKAASYVTISKSSSPTLLSTPGKTNGRAVTPVAETKKNANFPGPKNIETLKPERKDQIFRPKRYVFPETYRPILLPHPQRSHDLCWLLLSQVEELGCIRRVSGRHGPF